MVATSDEPRLTPARPVTPQRSPSRVMGKRIVCATPKQGRALDNYSLGDPIGRGAYSTVYKAIHLATGGFVAVKQIPLEKINSVDSIMSEINLLQDLKHPNIVKYLGFMKGPDMLSIVLEYCENGSLAAIYSKFGAFPENLVAMYISQVLSGLEYLHAQGTIHRDVKGANILTTKDGVAKLADFGVAMSSLVPSDNNFRLAGTPHWMAPEVIQLQEPSTACDIWSLGCTVVELRTGAPPYGGLSDYAAMYAVVQEEPMPIPGDSSSSLRDFLTECFQKDPNLRVTARELLKHAWIRKHNSVSKPVAPPDAVRTVKQWNSPSRRKKLEVPSALDLRAAYSQMENGDPKRLLHLDPYMDSESFDEGFGTLRVFGSKKTSEHSESEPTDGDTVNKTPEAAFNENLFKPSSRFDSIFNELAINVSVNPNRRSAALEDYIDEEADDMVGLELENRGSLKRRKTTEPENLEDPFINVDEILETDVDEAAIIAQGEAKQLSGQILTASDTSAITICARLCELLKAQPSVDRILAQNRIVPHIMELFQQSSNSRPIVLELLYLLMHSDKSCIETFCLYDGLSQLSQVIQEYPELTIRVVRTIISNYPHGPQVVISRRKLIFHLCSFVGSEKLSSKTYRMQDLGVLRESTQCISQILEALKTRNRAELWYQLNRAHLFDRVAASLSIEDEEARSTLYQLLRSYSKTLPDVWQHSATKHSLRQIMRAYNDLEPGSKHATVILQVFEQLSKSPFILELMHQGGLVPHLIRALRRCCRRLSPYPISLAHHLLPIFYNYCRLSQDRLRDAVEGGLVPLLRDISQRQAVLRSYAYPIICSLAHSGDEVCWNALWSSQCLDTLVHMISDRGWETFAIPAVSSWLDGQSDLVLGELLRLGAPRVIVTALQNLTPNSFADVVTSFANMLARHVALAAALDPPALFSAIAGQIQRPSTSTMLVKSLQVVLLVLDAQGKPASRALRQTQMVKTVRNLLESQDLPIICQKLAVRICNRIS